jgi:putative glutamine amidotransferase
VPPPLVAITTDLIDRNSLRTAISSTHYARRVHDAGGHPVLLPPIPGTEAACLDRFDAFIFTGGDDPRTEPFGVPSHPKITPVFDDRQEFETTLLRTLAQRRPDAPVLGVCLGMQMMALVAGGRLDQHMPETTPTHADHWDSDHTVRPVGSSGGPVRLASGTVRSKHRQAVADPGSLRTCFAAPDNIIEGVVDPDRRWYLGVQWHPERTADPALGQALFDALVAAAIDQA